MNLSHLFVAVLSIVVRWIIFVIEYIQTQIKITIQCLYIFYFVGSILQPIMGKFISSCVN